MEISPGDDLNWAASEPTRHDESAAAAPGGRIPLAEDDPTSQMIARIQIESLGYEVDSVADGWRGHPLHLIPAGPWLLDL